MSKVLKPFWSNRRFGDKVRSEAAPRRPEIKGLILKDKAENPAIYDSERSKSGILVFQTPFLAVLPYFALVEIPSRFGLSTGASGWVWGVGLLPFAVYAARFGHVDRLTYQKRHGQAVSGAEEDEVPIPMRDDNLAKEIQS